MGDINHIIIGRLWCENSPRTLYGTAWSDHAQTNPSGEDERCPRVCDQKTKRTSREYQEWTRCWYLSYEVLNEDINRPLRYWHIRNPITCASLE
jgi:hypothetical protein